jgi:uncharacterized protein (DUF1697 family)
MSDLKTMAEGLGMKNVRTLASTGNLVFGAPVTDIVGLEERLEAAFESAFGRHVDIIVRGAADWLRLAAGNPFGTESAAAPDQVAVRVMRQPVPDEAIATLRSYVGTDEKMQAVAGDIWICFSRATPNSRLLTATRHKRLGIGTSRNWNTMRKLADMVGA